MWQKAISCWRDNRVFFAIAFLLFCVPFAYGQVGQDYFTVDPANLYDWRSTLLNPSIGSYQNGAIEAGYKMLHLGFVDNDGAALKSGYLALNLPRRLFADLNFGVQSVFFSTPLFRETEFGVSLSRRFFHYVSFGAGLRIRGLSYQADNFDLVDPDDPVFADGGSTWQPDLNLSMTIAPWTSFVIGAAVHHLNTPSVSLVGSSVTLEPAISVGIAFNLGKVALHSSGRQVQNETRPSGFLQFHNEEIGYFQAGYEERSAWLRSRVRVVGAFSMGYGFGYTFGELQGLSSGSHEAFLVYEFDRFQSIPGLELPPTQIDLFSPPMSRIDVVPEYAVLANTEAVDIFSKVLTREFDDELDPKTISKLSEYHVGVLDSSLTERVLPFEFHKVALEDSSLRMRETYSSSYRSSLAKLRKDLQSSPSDVYIVAPETHQNRALALGNYIREIVNLEDNELSVNQAHFLSVIDSLRLEKAVNPDTLTFVEELLILRPRMITFSIYDVEATESIPEWQLVVENSDGIPVFASSLEQHSGDQIQWDWKSDAGQVIEPGFYRYYITWGEFGKKMRSPSRQIYARKLQRNIHVKITREYETPTEKPDNIAVILNK
jgi:hypothetical protein